MTKYRTAEPAPHSQGWGELSVGGGGLSGVTRLACYSLGGVGMILFLVSHVEEGLRHREGS